MSETLPQASDRVGVLISEDLETGQVVETPLIQCAHCAYTWNWIPGIPARQRATRLGRCMLCGGLVCGRPYCAALGCTCQERILENLEAGRPEGHKRIIVSTAGLSLD